MSRPPLVAIALVAALLLAGCGGGPGASCSLAGTGYCDTDAAALECDGGKLRLVPCRGRAGCTANASVVHCDQSGNRPGDACFHRDEGKAQSSLDGKSSLRCRGGAFLLLSHCAGGCSASGSEVVCRQ